MIYKVKAEEISFTTANTVYDSNLVRVYAAADSVVTVTTSGDAVVGSITIAGGSSELLEKDFTDTLTATSTISAVPVAYRT